MTPSIVDWLNQLVTESLMTPFGIVVLDVCVHGVQECGPLQRSLAIGCGLGPAPIQGIGDCGIRGTDWVRIRADLPAAG